MTYQTTRSIRLPLLLAAILLAGVAQAGPSSLLFTRGYTLLPEPQKVELTGGDFEINSGWRLKLGPGVKPDDAAVESLTMELRGTGWDYSRDGRPGKDD